MLPRQEICPRTSEIAWPLVKALNGLTEQLLAARAKESRCARIGFPADTLVVKNQDGVKGVLENRLKFTLGGNKCARCLPLLLARDRQRSGKQKHHNTEGLQARFPAGLKRLPDRDAGTRVERR